MASQAVVRKTLQRHAAEERELSLREVTSPRNSMVVARSAPLRTPRTEGSVVDALADTLVALGVQYAFGVTGGAIAPFCAAVKDSPIKLVHFRHESGAAFAALEASIASRRPVVVFCTTGPGLTNAITGMQACRSEGGTVIFVSGATGSAQRGRSAFQETTAQTTGLFQDTTLFHYTCLLDGPSELAPAAARLAEGAARPGGFVALLGLSLAVQTAPMERPLPSRLLSRVVPACSAEVIDECVHLLSSGTFAVWVGFGARAAARPIRELVRRTGARVMCSSRGKGIFPEDDPQFLGVTGAGGHASVETYMTGDPPDRVLVLGTRLGEWTSFWAPELVPPLGFVHVDVDPTVFGSAYPFANTLGVASDVGSFVDALLDAWPNDAARFRTNAGSPARETVDPQRSHSVRPSFLMQCIQRTFVDDSDAILVADVGNSLSLAAHYLRFREPARLRLSTGFASMGHGTTGVLGASLVRGKAAAIVGDGAMLMANEISTAVAHGLDAVWIVLNDARYGMIEEGMRSIGWEPFDTVIPRTDFVGIARAMGADGVRVQSEWELEAALRQALEVQGPFVVDVILDTSEPAPALKRTKSLLAQGLGARG
jgi:acetolactate synthase-1/2/3 large subunit